MSKATIFINGVVGEDTTLAGVISQYKEFDEPTSVDVFINSQGGYVEDGESIYNYISNLDVPVTTIATKAYSIAAQIFMSGSTRLVEDVEKPLMVHLPLIKDLTGNSETLIAAAEQLQDLENKFVDFYSEHLDLEKDTIKDLLKNETFLSADESVSLGFATGKKEALKAVALFEKNQSKNQTMSKKENDSILKRIAMKLGVLETVALVLQDANGNDVNFPDLESGETPSKDDKAIIDGSDAEGEVVMPSGETYVFEGGTLTEIKPADDGEGEGEGESSSEPEANADTDKGKETPKPSAEVIKEVLKWEVDVTNTSFEEGVKITREYDGEEFSIGAGEWELEDGRKIITGSDGVIVHVKDAEAGSGEGSEDGEGSEAEANADTDKKPEKKPEAKESEEDLKDKVIAALHEKVETLSKQVVSADIDEDAKPKKKKSFAEMTPLEKYRATKNQFR